MNHSSLEELTQAVHGLGPTPEHLALCAECLETVDRLRNERDLLRRADARLAAPLPRRKFGSLLPLALAAAALLAVTGVIVLRRDPRPPAVPAEEPQETPGLDRLLNLFLDGTDKESARARELLVDSARTALPALVWARHYRQASLRPDALSALILELKQKLAGPAADPIFQRLKDVRVTLDLKSTPLSDVLKYLSKISDLTIHLDPDLSEDISVNLKVTDVPLFQGLGLLSMLHGLEFDVRFGVLFVGAPIRLFELPHFQSSDKAIPSRGHWRKQELSAAGAALLKKLDALTVEMDFVETPMADVIGYLRDFAGVNLILEPRIGDQNVTCRAKNRPMASVLELLLLPRNRDLRIEGNTVIVFAK